MPNGGHFDCYSPGWYPPRETTACPHTIQVVPSVQEQMGTDPISKLAAAIERLAAALKGEGNRD